SKDKLIRLLQRSNGDVDQVHARLVQREYRINKWNTLDTRFGATVTTLQQEIPSIQSMRRIRLLKIMERFSGDVEQVRKFIQVFEERHHEHNENSSVSRHEKREELKTKYATHHVVQQKKEKLEELNAKYANQIAQLENDGIIIKNKQLLIRLLEKTDGQVDVVKQLLNERKEYRDKYRNEAQDITTQETDETESTLKERCKLSVDGIDTLKRLRSAGVHGNPMKVLAIFHKCNESIEMTIVRTQEERQRRLQSRDEQKFDNVYITINSRDDWPHDIEQVYLDGNNMTFFLLEQHDNLKIVKKNKRTIIVTSDRGLAALLPREGCLVVKSYNWFVHCVMTLTPDLINYQELTGTMTTTSTPPTMKIRYNFDELVHRIANIDI
ncbi:unnamed protein product, partial [Rotaria sp. Silwood1]